MVVVVVDFVKPSKLLISFNTLHLLHLIKTDTLYGDYILENQFHNNYLQISRKKVGDQMNPKLLIVPAGAETRGKGIIQKARETVMNIPA